MNAALLTLADLRVDFATPEGLVPAVRGVDLELRAGESLALVGESGAGKSQIFQAALGLLPPNGRATGSVRYAGEELLGRAPRVLNRLRGDRIGMVFQDPMSALNPYLSIGCQLTEVLQVHRGLDHREAWRQAAAMLEAVRIPDPARRLQQYPHQLSGGQRQRVLIAMALLCGPELLIADEPTTALDVTVQAEIMALLQDSRRSRGAALVLISHDLGLVAGVCERLAVLYAGRIVEQGATAEVLRAPRHPYTRGLLAASPAVAAPTSGRLPSIPGQPPNPRALPSGCAFRPRCSAVLPICSVQAPSLCSCAPGHAVACHASVAP
ncbi:MAG: ABC transporter ATP-binding protein [Thiotrichales bacterium]